MTTVRTDDKGSVIAVAQDGTPVTGAMVDEWCSLWDAGRLPDGYSVESPATVGRPPLHEESSEGTATPLGDTTRPHSS